MDLFVGVTDGDWYELLASRPGLDEVNFWQPGGNHQFKALSPGELFLFKLHSPYNYIVGGGVFAHASIRELFKELIRRRVLASGLLDGTFEEVWAAIIDPHIGTRSTFDYILDRTLMRPRDFLLFVHRAIEVAVNRGHTRISANDLHRAEGFYSEDLLKATGFELQDVFEGVPDFLYVFLGAPAVTSRADVRLLLGSAGLNDTQAEEALTLLAWFGFLGVQSADGSTTSYSYEMRYDIKRLFAPIEGGGGRLVVHPGFRSALESST